MNEQKSRKLKVSLSLLATMGLSAAPGFGQATTEPKVDKAQVLDKYVVTGSYLSPAANSIAVPVITIDSKTIENSGNNSNVLEILRKTTPQFSGNSNIGSQNANVGSGNTNGGSQVALRNTSTLVLVNGRRSAINPVSAANGYSFVDVNMIPVAAIERIEVLADGASAIYGTDAVAGVVNIILKTNYEGFEAGSRYAWSTNKGHSADRSAYVVGGVSNGKTSMTISAEYLKQDPIFNYERPYSDPTYGTPTFAGAVNVGSAYYYLDPSKNAPTVTAGGLPAATLVANGTYSGPRIQGDTFKFFNLAQYVTQTIQNERKSFTLAFDHKWNDLFKVFGDVLVVQTNTYSQINGQPINSSALAALPVGSAPGAGGTTIPAGLYGNPFNVAVTARNRLVDHPRQYLNDTQGARGIIGIGGKIDNNWSWETAATYNRITQDYQNPGVINNKALANAIVTGQFNFFARQQAPGVIENGGFVGTATGGFVSTLRNFDVKLSGTAFQLPAGPLDIAVGAEQRKEGLSAVADPNSQLDPVTGQLGWNGATTLYPFDANRSVGSLFAEVRAPIIKDAPGAHLLELSGAVRHEFYSDTTNPTVPKISVRYLPINDEFALRSTFSRSFSAPSLYQLFGPVSIGFTDPFTLRRTNGTSVANLQTNSQSGANSELKPSKAKNYTAGFVYSPKAVRGFSISVDYWNIKQTDLINSIPTSTLLQDVETKGPASQYSNVVRIGSFTGRQVTAPGQIGTAVPDDVYVTAKNVNIAEQNLDGYDVTAKYNFKAEGVGRFEVASNIGIYNHYTHVDVPGEPKAETVAKSTIYNGTIPRWQSYTTIDFTRDNYAAVVGWRSIPKITDDEDGERIGSFNSFDFSASYSFGAKTRWMSGAKVSVGVNNVFNKFGPKDPTIFSDSNVDIDTYGAVGRQIYIDVKFKF
ncbi:MAG: TonB-dependent receptor [Verrucomicrobia bacterium]|nr:TonB-dependent receptor [Verrucomicrobiota bacterium]